MCIKFMHHPRKKLRASGIKGKIKERDVRLVKRMVGMYIFWWIYVKDSLVGEVYIEVLKGDTHSLSRFMREPSCVGIVPDSWLKSRTLNGQIQQHKVPRFNRKNHARFEFKKFWEPKNVVFKSKICEQEEENSQPVQIDEMSKQRRNGPRQLVVTEVPA